MKRGMAIVVIWALTLLAGVSAQAQPQRSNPSLKQSVEYVDRQVIVKLKDNAPATEADALRNSVRARVLKRFPSIRAELWQLSGGTVEQAMARYRQDPRIEYIEPNYKVSLIQERIELLPNDPRFPQMWGLNNTGQTGGTPDADIDAPEAWDIETGNNVLVGVIDTGVDWQHEDLAANIWTNPGEIPNNGIDDDRNGYIDDIRGWDFVNNDNNPMDDNGHGTHVSGTIAAVGNNGIGTVGVSWSAKIMGLKFLNADGNGSTDDAILAVEYATRNGARLTSNSWGSRSNFSQALYDAIAAAGQAGILFIAAAGNDPIDNDTDPNPHYPSSYDLDNIIAVAATDHNDRKASFSAWGATSVDLGAPGVNILSTFPNDSYGSISGTSMATPHVSGVVSLIWSRVPGLPHLQVKDILLQTVDPVPDLQNRFPTVSGGRLNAFKALTLAEPDSIPPAPVTDLAAIDPKSNFITLTWTASGDDGDSGRAAAYDIRYSTAPINANNFAQATGVFGAPLPQPAGSQETFTAGGLDFNTTYYFALKVIDEQGNASEVSNSASNTTLGIPIIAVTPDSLADTLLTGAKSNHTLFISNEGEGTLDFNIAITGADSLAVSAQINFFALNRARQKSGQAEQQESHQAQYEAYKNGASAGLFSPAQPIANASMLELYRRFLATAADSTVIFHDNMENGVNGWSHYSTYSNRIDQWAQTKNRASSGATSWQVTQHNFEGSDALQSPFIDLTGYEDATLAFMHWHNFDDCNDPTFDPDGGILEVSSDGGARWTQIFPVGGYPYILDNTCFNPLTGYQAYSHDGGNGNAFIPALFDLRAYVGKEILLRWHAGWDCGNCALNEGWYVDDVTVYSTSFIGWLSANPFTGTVAAGDTMAISVTFDATGLNAQNYASNLAISSNDPNNPPKFIPARLQVIGAPDIALSDTAFDFGSVLLGDTAAVELKVSNLGTDVLTAKFVSDNNVYTVFPDSVRLNPKKSQTLLVRFIPAQLGEILGALTIISNDPDEDSLTVDLRGEALPPPVMAVSTDSLRQNLFTGQTSKRVLTITNSGGSDLKFALAIENTAVVIPAPLAKRRAQDSAASGASQLTPSKLASRPAPPKQWASHSKTRPANATVTKPRKKNLAQAALPVVIEDPAGDGGVVDITTLRGLSIGDELHIEMEFATTIVPSDFGGYLSVDIDQNPRTGFPPSFGLPGQDIGAEFEFLFFSLEFGVVDLFELRTGLFVGSYEVEILPNALRFSAPLADLGKDDGNMDVTGVLGSAFVATDWFPDEGHGTIGTGVTWITFAPDSGVVPAGSSVGIDVTFDAIGLKGGNYTADLVVTSNDPKSKKNSVDVHLQVTAAADIAATPTTLDFGQVFIGVKKILEVVVQNKGTVDLLITSAATEPSVFTPFPTLAGVDAGETEVFKVRFLPTAAVNYTGTLTLTSNDPDEPNFVVTLLGQGIVPPDISVAPPSLAFNLDAGDSTQAVMTIANSGGSPLDFTIRDVEASPGTALSGQKLYWTEPYGAVPDTIHRSNLDGTGIENLFINQTDPLGIEADAEGGRIYWAEIATGSISSSRLDGSDAKTLVSNLSGPVDIALDPSGGKMYWTDFNSGTITRANLDGSGVEIIVQSLGAVPRNVPGPKDGKPSAQAPVMQPDENALILFNPWGIALDLTHGKVYWTEQGGSRIGRANLDGSNVETVISTGLFGPRGIKIDAAGEKIYFVDSFNRAIKRANLDGRNVETLLQFNGNANPLDLDLDINAKHFYWSDNLVHLIQRANFDGSNVFPIISEPTAPPLDGLFGVGILSGTTWLAESPTKGRIQADSTLGIDIKVDTKGLNDGDYKATILVASNDPDEPEMPVPVSLHVTGVPRIAVSDDTLDFGEAFIGFPARDTLIVSNVGTALLSVAGISSDLLEFTAAPSVFDLAPGTKQLVVVTFKTDSVKTFSGQLTIASNDPDRPSVIVNLLGKGVVPPDIAVSPDSLSENLFTGETSTQTLTISNANGGSDLKFEISIAAARRNAVAKRQQDLSQLQKEISSEVLAKTGSYGAAAQTLPKKSGGTAQLPPDILLLTTTFVRGSVEQVLNNLGRPYDYLQTDFFTGIDFSPYTTLIVAMDGGFITEESVQALAIAAASGKKLIMLGGTSLDAYYRGIQAYLLSHTGEQGWTISQTPHLRVTDPTHPLAADLPSSANFNNFGAAYYMLRVDDPLASTAAMNGDNHPILLTKTIGAGTLIYFTNSPYEFHWNNPSDFAILQTVISNALEFLGPVSWLSADPIADVVPAGDSIEVAVTFNAAGMKGGDYFANLIISNNDPDEDSAAVPAHLHVTGAPAIAASPDTLNYGLVFIGATAIDTLIVSSIGTETLVVSGIRSDNADFGVDTTGFSLAPGETQEVLVRFSPSATGARTGTVTIVNNSRNKPEATVALLGTGLEPPDIAVSPDSLQADLFAGADTTQMVTISNLGRSDLIWRAAPGFASRAAVLSTSPVFRSRNTAIAEKTAAPAPSAKRPEPKDLFVFDSRQDSFDQFNGTSKPSQVSTSLEDALKNLNQDFADVTGVIPNRFDFSEGEFGYYIDDGGFDMYDFGNVLSTNFGFPLFYSNDLILDSPLFGSGGRYFTRKYPGLFVLAADMAGVTDFFISGNLGADGFGNVDGAILEMVRFGTTYQGFVKRVYNAGDPSVNHLVIIEKDPAVNHEFAVNMDDDFHHVFNLSGVRRLYYLLYAGVNGFYIDNTATLTIMDAFLQAVGGIPPWLTVTPNSGRVAPDSTVQVAVKFDATGLLGGDYKANVLISSNDPDEPVTPIHALLHVTGRPEIAVSDTLVNFGPVFISVTATNTLIVSNTGTDTLKVDSLVVNNPDYSVDSTGFNLLPGEKREVLVRFAPSSPATISGTLRIVSNASNHPDLAVALLGIGVVPPDIAARPDSLSESLITDEMSRQTLTISNYGGSDLKFEISIAAAKRSAIAKRQQDLSQLQKEISSEVLAKTGSYGGAAQTLPKKLDGAAQLPPDILLITTTSVRGSVEQVLNNLGRPYDFLQTDIFTGIDFSPYTTLIVAMDGGFITEESVQALAIAAASGKKLIMLGGTSFDSYYRGIQAYLLSHTGQQGWTISQTPHLRVTDPTHPLAADLPSADDFNNFNAAYYMLRVNDPLAAVAAINGDNHPILLDKKIGDGTLIYFTNSPYESFWSDTTDFAILQTVISNALEFLGPVSWLSADPISGAVPAGDSIEVALTFDAAGMKGGDYFANLIISNNDPDEDSAAVPAHLHVTGIPKIAVSDSVLDFGTVFIGVTATDTLIVSNQGTDSLRVSSITPDNPDYTVSLARFTLAIGESRALEVNFTPSVAEQRNGTLTIESNDEANRQLKVALVGEGVEPPVISVAPSAFELRVDEGDSTTAVMTITNNGASPLHFKIRDEESSRTLADTGQKLYWTESYGANPDTLHRSNLDGTNIEAVFTIFNSGGFTGITVDEQGGRIYWADYNQHTIRSSNLDGSDARVLIPNVSIPIEIAIDHAAGKIYWTDFSEGAIYRANLDGSGTGVIVRSAAGAGARKFSIADIFRDYPVERQSDENALLLTPWGIALDLAHGKMYWTEQDGNRISRANLDGSGVETIISFGISGPRGIKVDADAGKIYFVDSFNNAIKRANLNGSNVETLVASAGALALNLDLDTEAQQFYWTDIVLNQVKRANFDGSNVQVIVNSARANAPFGIGLSLGTGWLTEAPTNGTIAAGASQDIQIKLDASKLTVGNYSADILIESNDPDPQRKVVTVPVNLRVTAGDLLIAIADTLHGVPNETVDVPIFLALNRDSLAVAAFGATLKATNKILTFAGFTPGPLVEGQTFNVTAPAPDSLNIAFVATSGGFITQDGLLATLRFQISPNALEGQTALMVFDRLVAADSSDKVLAFAADNGKLTVNKALLIAGQAKYFGTDLARPVANLDANLLQNGTSIQETKTDAAGNYLLAGIIPNAEYRVEVRRLSGGAGSAVTPIDALMALRGSLNGGQKLAADVDGNLAIEQNDANMILDFFLGLITQFPVESWRTFPASYDINATPDAWKTAPEGIDYPGLKSDQTRQDYFAVVRGDVDLDWSPTAATQVPATAENAEAPLQLAAISKEVMPGVKTITWQIHLDGAGIKQGVYALGADVQYDAAALEITHVRWGKSVPAEGFKLGYRILPAATNQEKEALNGRLRFGGFSTAGAAIREAGAMIEVEAQLRADVPPGAWLPIRFANVSAVLGLSEAGLSKSNGEADFAVTAVAALDGAVKVANLPVEFALRANYPNPFNPSTRIRYELPENAAVKLEIFNTLGQKVKTLLNGEAQPAGYYTVEWNGRSEAEAIVPSGVYFYRFEAKGASKTFAKTHKMLMVK